MGIIYEAFFVQDDLESKLTNDIQYKHITTEFRPSKIHEHLYGQRAIFRVVGYGNDGINEGYSVNLVSCESDELRELYEAISVPHVTLSISPDGKAVNTKNLSFNPVQEFKINTIFGGFIGKPTYKNQKENN